MKISRGSVVLVAAGILAHEVYVKAKEEVDRRKKARVLEEYIANSEPCHMLENVKVDDIPHVLKTYNGCLGDDKVSTALIVMDKN